MMTAQKRGMQFSEVASSKHDRTTAHILVVDDERPIVDLLCMLLEEEGFEVTGATTGHGAADVIRSQRPDLVLTDVMMPGMSGYDLADLATDMYPDIRVVLMSAAVDPPARPVFPFLPKPFDLGTVVDVIDQELRAS